MENSLDNFFDKLLNPKIKGKKSFNKAKKSYQDDINMEKIA